MTRAHRRGARVAASLLALGLAISLAACAPEGGGAAQQYREGDNKGFIAGDGTVEEIPAERRGDPVSFAGTGIDGEAISSEDMLGEVVVVNFWFAGCAPCRTEAPILQQVYEETDAAFIGANIYDGPEQARAFETSFGITYPSLLLVKDDDLKLTFAAWTPIAAAPTTLVLDTQGRVAARFLGPVKETSILRTIVQDLAAEQS